MFEVDCSSSDHVDYCCKKYIVINSISLTSLTLCLKCPGLILIFIIIFFKNDIAQFKSKCAFIISQPEDHYNNQQFNGLIDFCDKQSLEWYILNEASTPKDVFRLLKKISPQNFKFSSSFFENLFDGGKINCEYLKEKFYPKTASLDSYLYPALLIVGFAVLFYRKRVK